MKYGKYNGIFLKYGNGNSILYRQDHILAHFAIPGGLTCLSCGLTFLSRRLFAAHMTADHKSFKKWT